MLKIRFAKLSLPLFVALSLLLSFRASLAQEENPFVESVELNGDTVEYAIDGNRMMAQGNVVIKYKDAVLTCDKVDFSRDTKIAHADGNVRLTTPTSEISGDKLVVNMETMTGQFNDAKLFAAPFYGGGKEVNKVSENHIVVNEGFITTCDHDKPHFGLAPKKIDIHTKEKMVARGIRVKIGNTPLMYFPRLTQRLDEKEPAVILTPGYDKDWGMFVLSKWRYKLNDYIRGHIRVDLREKKDIASGLDLNYNTPHWGSGSIRTYYMNERNLQVKRFYEERLLPTIERERFKAEWRHKWQIDKQTDLVLQYYKLSDPGLLKDYFRREHSEDSSPDTFLVLTRSFEQSLLSFRLDKRVNRFESQVERLPEIRWDLTNQEIGSSKFYFKNVLTISNLNQVNASPSDVQKETVRIHNDSEISRPTKVGIFEFTPFVGGRETYYSRTKDTKEYDVMRGMFRTGANISTKFFKIFDVPKGLWGMDIKRIRHIITPSVGYEYVSEPTRPFTLLDQFDEIDALDNIHNLQFGFENRIQGKRTKGSRDVVDIFRSLVTIDFRLKEDPRPAGFDYIVTDNEFRPFDWLSLYFDTRYDTKEKQFDTANVDLYINGKDDKWNLGIGKRYDRIVDDQVTLNFNYKLNPKWAFHMYERFDTSTGTQKEQQYTIRRDLHEWYADLSYNETRGQGSEIWLVFTLKAFPEMTIDLGGVGFNRRKAGSQSP